MFSRSLFCALLGLYVSALTAEAVPRFGGGFKQDDTASASCDLASIVTQTVTVTASAVAATATGGNANSGGSGSGNSSNGGTAGSGNGGSNAGNSGNNNGNGATGGNANSGGSGSDNSSTGGAVGSGNGGSNVGNSGNNNGAGTGNADVDAQTSLTLDPRVIAKGFANDGQDVPAVGQVASLTSTNNFINFCLTVANTPITDGKQVTTGSCNPAPIGVIPSTDNMPSSKFVTPANFGTVQADTPFTISMAINNIETGNFVNAQENYFAAPQQLTSSGLIIGHTHVVVETIDSLDQKTPTNPKNFAFFKGVNGKAVNGVVTADVTNGLPAGVYRLCSINSSSNHQPVIVPVAQHGSLDDCVYFTSTANGKAAGIVASSQAGARASATATAISSSGAVSASVSDSAAVNTNAVASSAIVSATAVASDASASVTGVASAVGPTDVPSASAIDNGADVSSSATDAVPSASDDSGNGREGNKKGHGKGK